MMMSVMKTLVLLLVTNILLLAIGAPIADDEPPISVNTECAKVTSGSETGEVHLLDQSVSKNEFQDDEEWCNDCDATQLEEKLRCHKRNRPIPDEEMWRLLRRAYTDVVGTEESAPHATFYAPVHVEQTDKKGRGIFATGPIKKGDPVWDSDEEAVFEDRESLYKFLKSIPQLHVCDVLSWAWTEYENVPNSFKKRLVLALNLDESAMINNSRSKKLTNIGCDPYAAKKFEGGCDKYEFALKDIEAGEEIISFYDAGEDEAWDSFFGTEEALE
jgi:hypothetical protein